MNSRVFARLKSLLKGYLELEGYKVKFIESEEAKYTCHKCFASAPFESRGILMQYSERVLCFYVSRCDRCKIAYVHKNIELRSDESNDTKQA